MGGHNLWDIVREPDEASEEDKCSRSVVSLMLCYADCTKSLLSILDAFGMWIYSRALNMPLTDKITNDGRRMEQADK